jgi:hypothetical protein
MHLKTAFVLIILISGIGSAFAQKSFKSYAESSIRIEEIRGKRCEKANSLELIVTNLADYELDIRIAIKKADGEFAVSSWSNTKSKETIGKSMTTPFFHCDPSDVYYVWVRPSSKANEMKFPSKEEIKKIDELPDSQKPKVIKPN